ncbi:MAG: LPS export ABC transporter periplasmic protein LptC [bacterium]
MRRWLPLVWLAAGILVGVAALRIWQGAPAGEVFPPQPPEATPGRPAPPSPAAPAPKEPAPLPSVQLERGRLTGTNEAGQKQWELRTEHLTIEENQQRVVLGRVQGQFFKQGTAQMTVTAARAVYLITTKDVELIGDVTARTPDGRTLRAPHVRWDAARTRIVASGGVSVTQAGMVIRADQVISDVNLKNTTFSGHVVVTVAGGK